MKIHSIAACCKNGGIGKDGKLPWRLKKEMSHFQKFTKGMPPEGKKNVVLFGRRTWESIPCALKGRYNFVLSRTMKEKQDGMDALVHSLDELMEVLASEEWRSKIHEVFNVGGAEIYKIILNSSHCGRVYLTRVKSDYDCDTFFPELDKMDFKLLDGCPEDVAYLLPSGVQVEANGTEWFVEVYEKNESS